MEWVIADLTPPATILSTESNPSTNRRIIYRSVFEQIDAYYTVVDVVEAKD